MKKAKKICTLMLCMSMLISMFSINVLAASGSVKVSSNSGTVGSTVSISCTASISGGSSIGGAEISLTYDPSALQLVSWSSGANGGGGSVYFSQFASSGGSTYLSFSMQFKILKEGSHKITVSSAEVFDWETTEGVSTSKSGGSITGKAVTTTQPPSSGDGGNSSGSGGGGNSSGSGNNTTPAKDTNSKLNSLQVYPGSLSPAFNANTTSYTVNVTDEYKDVTITAAAQSSKASVSVSGGKNLQVGSNAAKVVVVAESGATTVYNITIVCEKLERVTIGEKEYTINNAFSDEEIPEGFTKQPVKYNEKEYTGLKNTAGNLLLICLKDGEQGSSYYIYDQEKQSFLPFIQISIAEGRHIIPVEAYENTEFTEIIKLKLQDKEVGAWKIDEEFSVIPVINEKGEKLLYKYDSVDGTYQRYSSEVPVQTEPKEEPEPEKQDDILAEYGWYIIAGLGTITGILMIVLIYILATKNRKHNARRRRSKRKQDKEQ